MSIAENGSPKRPTGFPIFLPLCYSVANIVSTNYSKEGIYRERGRHQPVQWLEYDPRTFALAGEKDQPVLLVSGTTWSARCLQLDEEAFWEEESAAYINDHFIPVRIDRDELPEVDFRLQSAVDTLSQESGWPLVAFLTAEEQVFFGGTYYPKVAIPDRPSFACLLETVVQTWSQEREQVEAAALSLKTTLEEGKALRRLDGSLVEEGLEALTAQYDSENGGFSQAEGKRLWPGALELLQAAAQADRPELESMVETTLIHMGRGAVFDQIGGGFHRRTHDAMWLAPSFEKLLCDNAEMLRLYLLAYQASGTSFFAEIAARTIDYLFRELCDLEEGGFYASQSADEEYYTWTTDEVMKAVPVDCVKAVGHHFHFQPGVENIPYRALDAPVIAERFSQEPLSLIEQRIEKGRDALYAYRQRRTSPFTDERIFAGWNARAAEAFELAGRTLGRKECTEFAEKTRKRIEGQDRMAIFDEIEDNFGPSRLSQSIKESGEASIQDLGPSHGSLLHALFNKGKK